MASVCFHSTNSNGPVPTGWKAMSLLPHLASAAGEIIAAEAWPSALMKGPKGSLSVMRRVCGFTASTLATRLNWLARSRRLAGSITRSRLALAAAALKSVPSWNFTPERSLKV